MISISVAVILTLVWLASLPDLRHPRSWLNERLAALGAAATTGAVIAAGLVVLMLSPIGRAFGGLALQKLRMLIVAGGVCVTVVALMAMRTIGHALARARRAAPPAGATPGATT